VAPRQWPPPPRNRSDLNLDTAGSSAAQQHISRQRARLSSGKPSALRNRNASGDNSPTTSQSLSRAASTGRTPTSTSTFTKSTPTTTTTTITGTSTLNEMRSYLAQLEERAKQMGINTDLSLSISEIQSELPSDDEICSGSISPKNQSLINHLNELRKKATELGINTDDLDLSLVELPDFSVPPNSLSTQLPPLNYEESPRIYLSDMSRTTELGTNESDKYGNNNYSNSNNNSSNNSNNNNNNNNNNIYNNESGELASELLEDPMEHILSSNDIDVTLGRVEDLKQKLESLQMQAKLLGIDL